MVCFLSRLSIAGGCLVLVCLLMSPAGLMASSSEGEAEQFFEEGTALNKQRLFNDAIIQFAQAVKLSMNTHKYHRALFNTYTAIRRGSQGARYYQGLTRSHPKNSTVHYWLGRYYLATHVLEKAVDAFKKSSELAPEDEHAFISLGHVAKRLGRQDEALEAYLRADRLVPDIPVVKVGIGSIYYDKEEFDKAEAAYKAALDQDGSYMEARFNLGLIFEKKGEYGDAAEQWQMMLEEDPNESEARERLAKLFFKAKLYIDAVREYSTLSLVRLNDAAVFMALGEAQVLLAAELPDPEDRKILQRRAIESFERTVELQPGNKKAQQYLARLKEIKIPGGQK